MLLDDAFDDGQTESLPTGFAVARRLGHIEALENLFLVFPVDADAVIGHSQHRLVTFLMDLDMDIPLLRRELDGIGQKIRQHLADFVLIRRYHQRLTGYHQGDIFFGCCSRKVRRDFFVQSLQVKTAEFQFFVMAFHFVDFVDVPDQA